MSGQRRRRTSLAKRLKSRLTVLLQSANRGGRRVVAIATKRLRPAGPVVLVDGPAARRLGPLLANASRQLAVCLGAELPAGLTIVVQRVVYDGRGLNGSLQVFDASQGGKRYLLLLAQSVNGRQASDEDLLAVLRFGLVDALADQLGKPVRSTQIDLDVPRARPSAPVVSLRPGDGPTPVRPDADRSSLPIQRVQVQDNNNHHA